MKYTNSETGYFYQTIFTKVLDNVSSVSVGQRTTAAIRNDKSLWMWGNNSFGELGNGGGGNAEDGGRVLQTVPTKVMNDVTAVSTGNTNTAAIKTDGSLWMWGDNSYGQLGKSGMDEGSTVPVKVMDNVIAVSVGDGYVAAVKTNGSLWMWGNNGDNQLGNGGKGNADYYTYYNDDYGNEVRTYYPRQTAPVKILDDVATVSVKHDYTAAIKTDGSLWMWGRNYQGQFGDGTYQDSDIPVRVLGNVSAVSLGDGFTAAIKTDGSLWTWGRNSDYGQLGDGTMVDSLTPVKVLDNVAAISAGKDFTIALKYDGTFWGWGNNTGGSLGNNGEGNKKFSWGSYQTVPTQITQSDFLGVRISLNGGNGTSTLWAPTGKTLTPPDNPTKPGYSFAGWYTNAALTKPWNFNTGKATVDLVLYAKWVPVSSNSETADRGSTPIKLDGKSITLNTYVLKDEKGNEINFVKLRDIAALLDGTNAQCNVDWKNGAIRVTTAVPYTTRNSSELTDMVAAAKSYKTNTAPVIIDGYTKPLEGIILTDQKGGGHTFFKLRDLGVALGFNVGWDGSTGAITISTGK